ncbi:MAG: hypothetical protein REI96_11590 [Flavobacterium nitrogenifigens]|uniref:hypothetical protein n=1 Tax=Flavobacterium nitrogenifigens TaxID=1617283 RepID=UPI002809A3BE|nr:hypothetical protein [Flavobacterium nitrogenifigens]MDQ8013084.1 hypothetical protein [Flavobacterium nitrogenifigens]
MKKLYFTFFIILFINCKVCSQTYIMYTNAGDAGGYTFNYYIKDQYYYRYWIKKTDGNLLYPIKVVNQYLIFDQKPTQFYFDAYRPESYSCSGPCGEDWTSGLEATNFNANCYKASGISGGRSGAEIIPEFSIISNQVLTQPSTDNSFCDKVNLQATGCTGTQRFVWEYRIEGGNFQSTNISTGFNQTFQFNRSTYVSSTYVGNIDFRVLIDSDTSVNGEEVYSNIVSYYVNPCPPVLNSVSSNNLTSCVYKSDGEVTLNFDRELLDNEQYEMALTHADGSGLANKTITKSMMTASPKSYTWKGLGIQSYILNYQTRLTTANGTSLSQAMSKTFKVDPPTQFSYQIITTQPVCNNQPGIIKIIASNGTSPYFYSIDSTAEVEFLSTSEDIALPAGDHYITVRDSKSCIDITANDQKI